MAQGKAVKVGDIFCVSLGEKMLVTGIVLHVSKVFKNAMMVGFYDRIFEAPEDIDITALHGEFIDVPNYTGKQLITSGRWKVVGNNLKLLTAVTIPELRVVSHVYYQDTIVRQILPTDYKNYTELRGQGGSFIERKLRKHFMRNVLSRGKDRLRGRGL